MSTPNFKTAIVTGASAGIGRASARMLAEAGYTVFGTSRNPSQASLGEFAMLPCDVTDEKSVSRLISTVMERSGRIDLLVNNAGVGLLGGAEESSTAQAQRIFDVNVFGVMRTTRAVLPIMRELGRARIINVSSLLGLVPAPYSALYAASKHALEGYSESLDHEVRTLGIRVSLIEPGYTQTEFEGNMLSPDLPLSVYDGPRANVARLTRAMMAGADPADLVGRAVVDAALDAKPRLRYKVGAVSKRVGLLRRMVPEAVFDKSFRRRMRLPA